MIWAKIAVGVLGISVLLGAGLWLVHTIKENERLTLNNATLEQARQQDAEVMEFLRKDIAAKERAATIRSQKIVDMSRRLEKARREVRTITNTVVTEVERECLFQPVPAAVIDFMLDNQPADPDTGS